MRLTLITLYLFIFWLLLTLSFNPFSLLLGGAFSLIIALATRKLFPEKEKADILHWKHFFRFDLLAVYLLILLWEIYLASFDVVYRIITLKISPGLVKIKTRLKSGLAQAILANSITLTPGTLTVDLEDEHLLVHCLVVRKLPPAQMAKKIKGNYEAILRRLF